MLINQQRMLNTQGPSNADIVPYPQRELSSWVQTARLDMSLSPHCHTGCHVQGTACQKMMEASLHILTQLAPKHALLTVHMHHDVRHEQAQEAHRSMDSALRASTAARARCAAWRSL